MRHHNLLVLLNRHFGVGVAVSLVAVALAITGSCLGLLSQAELALSDWRDTHATMPPSGQTLIVGIDQQTLAEYGGWPLDRTHIATVLSRLGEAGASRIYFDSSLARDSQPDDDALLEQALQRLGSDRVALPVALLKGKPDANGQQVPVRIGSMDRFSGHATVVAADMPFDGDGRIRVLGRTVFDHVAEYPTVAAWLAHGRDARPGILPVNFGIDLQTIPVISFKDVAAKDFSADLVHGKQIIVGVVAENVTPPVFVPRYDKIQRAEFMALAAETLLVNVRYRPASFWIVMTTAAVMAIIFGSLLPRCGMALGAALTLLGLMLLCLASVAIQRRTGLSLPLAVPMAGLVLTYVGTLVATHPSFHQTRQAVLSLVNKVDYGLARLFHSGVDAIITFSPDGKILTANDTAAKLFGMQADAILGRPLSAVLPDTAESLLRSASGHQPGRLVAKLADMAGQERHVDMAFNAVPSETGWIGYASIRDITEMKLREERLKHQATHDAMTTLPNRAAFERHLDATLRFAADTCRPFALLLLDLNKFKQVNDTLGHQLGDALLVVVAKHLKSAVHFGDFVARLGGDEFAVVLAPPTDRNRAEFMAAQIVSAVASIRELEGLAIDTGVSIGVVLYPEQTQSAEHLMRLADAAMYSAKRGQLGFKVAETTAGEPVPC